MPIPPCSANTRTVEISRYDFDQEFLLNSIAAKFINRFDDRMSFLTLHGYVIESVITKYPTVEVASTDAGYRGNTVHHAEIRLDTLVHISTKIRDTFAFQ